MGEFDILQSNENVTIINARGNENVTRKKTRRKTNNETY